MIGGRRGCREKACRGREILIVSTGVFKSMGMERERVMARCGRCGTPTARGRGRRRRRRGSGEACTAAVRGQLPVPSGSPSRKSTHGTVALDLGDETLARELRQAVLAALDRRWPRRRARHQRLALARLLVRCALASFPPLADPAARLLRLLAGAHRRTEVKGRVVVRARPKHLRPRRGAGRAGGMCRRAF